MEYYCWEEKDFAAAIEAAIKSSNDGDIIYVFPALVAKEEPCQSYLTP